VSKTGVDTIAAAVGTAHGVYDNEDIIVPLLKSIKAQSKKTFVLHGGSGLPSQKIKKAVREGVNIINIGSDIKIAFAEALKKTCLDNVKETDPRKLMSPSILAIEDVVMKHMKIFGSAGRVK
jgi:fructose/tagatose bisphosphate aldolase